MGYAVSTMYFDEFKHQLPDIDPDETEDWLASLDQVVATTGNALWVSPLLPIGRSTWARLLYDVEGCPCRLQRLAVNQQPPDITTGSKRKRPDIHSQRRDKLCANWESRRATSFKGAPRCDRFLFTLRDHGLIVAVH